CIGFDLMRKVKFLTLAQLVAQSLREQIMQGRWNGTIPGKPVLAAEMGICQQTVQSALLQLEREGLLVSQGAGRNRRIVLPAKRGTVRGLRVGLLLWDATDRSLKYILELQHRLVDAGHIVVTPPKTLMELKMDVTRVARMVQKTEADVWAVAAGSLEVLQWFSQQKPPVYALFGRGQDLPISSIRMDKRPAIFDATRTLVKLGHRRIVILLRRQHRLPSPAYNTLAFIDAMKGCGIQTSSFFIPDWEESAEGFQECLEELFKFTPPTALFLDEALFFSATLYFLTARNLRVPQDVSLICNEPDPTQAWCVRSVAHIYPDYDQVPRHFMNWLDKVAMGRNEVTQTVIEAKYASGGTVGPVAARHVDSVKSHPAMQ
ncbi:MAG: substrate-binding domain-containing protein, partial [Verrucomicrobiaceae bacterium]